ncbi:MAG: selenocysteine-specific translation elongation factor [Actinomycetota bacterium]
MHVVATAGHVDHGKSTLVRLLTGMEPDRWAEEHRRGLTIDLGFAWTRLPSGAELAIVDVPGHERFVPNMLAGVGHVPAALLVVAADEGWMPQSEEHLAALHAFGVRHGVLAVSRSDLAPPERAMAEARERLARTSLAGAPTVAVSGATGEGLDALRAELDALAAVLPAPDTGAPVRLWVDRSFAIKGAGTVVTGTLPAGTIEVGDELRISRTGRAVRVRSLQTLGRDVPAASAVARVAVNLRGVDRHDVVRGDALVGGAPWKSTDTVDVRLHAPANRLPRHAMLHVGSAAVSVVVRPLGELTARLRPAEALPLTAGDRGLLRDPGRHLIVAGVTVLDAAPAPLRGRGAARARGDELERLSVEERSRAELRRRRFMAEAEFGPLGLAPVGRPVAGGWRADPSAWRDLPRTLAVEVAEWEEARPLERGMPAEAARQRLGVPTNEVLGTVAAGTGMRLADGRVTSRSDDALPTRVSAVLAELEQRWRAEPFVAPGAEELRDRGLGPREVAAAARAGRLLRLGDGVVLPPDADARAFEVLCGLPGPTFTLSEARQALGTTRRVAVPLLELLDRQGRTERISADARRVVRDG